jgi:hypothetical protein
VYTFIELMTPALTRKLVDQAMGGEQPMYEL